jgi:hypothetical protein
MPGLGNGSIATGESRIRIVHPAARDLLDLAMRCNRDRRRVLFFCACEYPRWCHRNTVGTLILRQAEKADRQVEIVEWPGGGPVHRTLPLDQATYNAVAHGRKSLPLGKRVNLPVQACLPWGSIVRLRAAGQTVSIVTGPAKYCKGWSLPVLQRAKGETDGAILQSWSDRFRKHNGLEPRRA